MALFIVFLLLALIAAAPVSLLLALEYHGAWQGDCVVRLWGLPIRLQAYAARITQEPERKKAIQGGGRLHHLWRRADKTRAFLQRQVKVQALDIYLAPDTGDAARTALLCGTVQALLEETGSVLSARGVPHDFRVLPGYCAIGSHAVIRCILSSRLGSIILGGLMALCAYVIVTRREKRKEEKQWNIPSEI